MQIFLRPIERRDTPNILKWRNSENVRSHCMTKTPITEESHLKFYDDYIETGKYKQFIIEKVDDVVGAAFYPIATVYLKDLDYGNKRCELCIFTSDDTEWVDESKTIAIKMLIEKAFNEYGMHKVYTNAFYKFSDEVELLKSAGFTAEAILKEEAINEKGEYEDIVRLSIFNK